MRSESVTPAAGAAALAQQSVSAEADLVDRARRGLPDAWTQIYHENYTKLFRYAFGRVGHRETAEDLAATVFLEALKSIKGYRHGDRPLLAWLYSIARNVVNQHHRRRLRRGGDHISLGEVADPIRDQIADPSRMADRMELLQALDRLSASQREVVLLHHFVGLTLPEVARLLEKNERAVYSLHTRAVQGMRRHLDGGERRNSGKRSE